MKTTEQDPYYFSSAQWNHIDKEMALLLSCQPGVTVTSCFVYKVIRDLCSLDHLCINPILRIGLIHKWSIDSSLLKWSLHFCVLLSNSKQSIMSLSLLVGWTVDWLKSAVGQWYSTWLRIAGLSFTGGAALCPWTRHFIFCVVLVQPR